MAATNPWQLNHCHNISPFQDTRSIHCHLAAPPVVVGLPIGLQILGVLALQLGHQLVLQLVQAPACGTGIVLGVRHGQFGPHFCEPLVEALAQDGAALEFASFTSISPESAPPEFVLPEAVKAAV